MENQIRIPETDDVDNVDRAILDAMHQDGRIAFAQIAHRLGVSPGMIRVRYNRLVEMGMLKAGTS